MSCYPNAGMPDGFGGFLGDKRPARPPILGEFARNGWLNIVGGCCGTTPRLDRRHRPRQSRACRPAQDSRRCRTGRPTAAWSRCVIRPETNFIMIGERTNITGSKRFARLIKSGDYEAALAVAREQVEGGRQHPRRQHGRGPDRRRAGDDPVPQPGLGRPRDRQGPDHGRQLEVERHRGGAQVRPGQVDRQLDQPEGGRGRVPAPGPAGPPIRRRRGRHGVRRSRARPSPGDHKVAICHRAYKLLTEQVGFPPEDIIFDVNILTVGTGIEEHNNYAVEFIEAVRELKRAAARLQDLRRRQQRVVLVPRQRRRSARR